MTLARQRARGAYARAVQAKGPQWKNTADMIRGGFENLWISPALDALEATLRRIEADPDYE